MVRFDGFEAGKMYHYYMGIHAEAFRSKSNAREKEAIARSIVDAASRALENSSLSWNWLPMEEVMRRLMQKLEEVSKSGVVVHRSKGPARIHYEVKARSKPVLLSIVIGLQNQKKVVVPGCDFRESPYKDVKKDKFDFKPKLRQLQDEVERRHNGEYRLPGKPSSFKTVDKAVEWLVAHPIVNPVDVKFFMREIAHYRSMVERRVQEEVDRKRASQACQIPGSTARPITPPQLLNNSRRVHTEAFGTQNEEPASKRARLANTQKLSSNDNTLLDARKELLRLACNELRRCVENVIRNLDTLGPLGDQQTHTMRILVKANRVCRMKEAVLELETRLGLGHPTMESLEENPIQFVNLESRCRGVQARIQLEEIVADCKTLMAVTQELIHSQGPANRLTTQKLKIMVQLEQVLETRNALVLCIT